MRAERRIPFAIVLAAIVPALARAQVVAPGGFVILTARDTFAVERITGGGDSARAELRIVPSGARVRQTLVAGARAQLARYVLETFAPGAPPDAAPSQRITFRFDGDTVRVEGGAPPTLAVAMGTLPWLNPSMALVEQMVRRARAVGGARVTVPLLNVTGAQRFTAVVESIGVDSTIVSFPDVQMRLATARDGRVLGGAIPAQALRIVRTDSLAPSSARGARPDYAAPPGAPYVATDVEVATPAGFSLAGTFTRPRGAGRVPAVVLITGSGLEDRDEAIPSVSGYRPFREIADTLARRGIAALRLDDRGFGGSGGNGATATSADFAADVRTAVAWLRARPDVDPRRIALIGHSEGGLIAPLVASSDSAIAAVVLLAAPAWTGRRIIAYQNGVVIDRRRLASDAARRDSLVAGAMRAVDSAAVVSPWLRYFLDHDPLPVVRRVRVPTLILQGATDEQITPGQATELATAMRAAGNARVTLRTFPATNHLFLADSTGDATAYASLPDTRVRPTVLGAIADWLAATLRR